MEYFCGNKDEYIKYLKQEMPWKSQYIDPDGTYTNNKSTFYNELTQFLEARKKNEDIWSYSFPSKRDAGNSQPVGIRVYDSKNSEYILYLRSDQFGFTVPKKANRTWDNKYPYASYLKLDGEKEFVAECIWDMRTLGGCFLWPLIRTGNRWKSLYNTYRGVRSYIEDRVDLTLYEIQSFYNVLKEYPNEKDSEKVIECLTNRGYILLRYKDKDVIYKWLKHFKTFKGYIDYFCFRPFVNDQYEVIDIINSKLAKDEMDEYGFAFDCPILNKETVKEYRISMQKRIETIKDKEKIKQILINVRNMTLRRTKYMETILLYNQEMRKHLEK